MIIRHVERAATILMALCLLAPGGTAARTSGRGPVRIRVLERTAQPLLVSDRPWEAFTLSYLSVIKTGGMWQLWYGSYDPEYKYDCDAYLCYARSSDGVHWTKPELGLVPFKGDSRTNILIDGRKIRANATTVFRDEHAPRPSAKRRRCRHSSGLKPTSTECGRIAGRFPPTACTGMSCRNRLNP